MFMNVHELFFKCKIKEFFGKKQKEMSHRMKKTCHFLFLATFLMI